MQLFFKIEEEYLTLIETNDLLSKIKNAEEVALETFLIYEADLVKTNKP